MHNKIKKFNTFGFLNQIKNVLIDSTVLNIWLNIWIFDWSLLSISIMYFYLLLFTYYLSNYI